MLDWQLLTLMFVYILVEISWIGITGKRFNLANLYAKTFLWDLLSFGIVIAGLGFYFSNAFTFGLHSVTNSFSSFLKFDYLLNLPLELKIPIAILLYDFLSYWRHRFFHSHKIWWQAHSFHHSATHLNPISGFRSHPIQNLYSNLFVGIPLLIIFGFDIFSLLPVYLLSNISNFFTHGRIDTSLGWIGRNILVTPRYHHLHHAIAGSTHCNFGDIFVFWDKLFGTYRAPNVSIYEIQTGIEDNYFEKGNMFVAFFKPVWLFYREIFVYLGSLFPKKTLAK